MVGLNSVMNIEVSSLCDNNCPYCPAQKQKEHRAVGIMSMDTFMKAIRVLDYCVKKGTQTEVNMYGIGEPTLNRNLVEMTRIVREHLPPRLLLRLNTNGNCMTEELALGLKKAGIGTVDVTGHDPRPTANAIRILQHHGIFGQLSRDFITGPNNWAGQVDWFEPEYDRTPYEECPWLKNGQVMITWDGKLTTCCMDAFGQGVVGNVDNDLSKIEIREYNLCKNCHHKLSYLRPLPDRMILNTKTGTSFKW